MKFTTLCVILILLRFLVHGQSLSTQVSEHLHIDQFGYPANAQKVAVISDPVNGYNSAATYTPGTNIAVINAQSLSQAGTFSPTQWKSGAVDGESGDRGWWLDFSSISSPGSYFLYDATNNSRSNVFEIRDDIYNEILKSAGRMFYYNRCNFPKQAPYAETKWTDSNNNFLNTNQDSQCRYFSQPTNNALLKDLSGGWFDAGDYNKYITFAAKPVHELLHAYEFNPTVFGDNWNIPESNNGVSDLLDELKWELGWIKKMQNTDGSVIIKMGSIDYGHNAAAPPSNNFDPRYYGPTCTSAAIATAGMLAHAAFVFSSVPALSGEVQDLKNKAVLSWNYVLPRIQNNTLETACDDGTIKAGDADWDVLKQKEDALIAAFYLFLATGEETYHTYFKSRINDSGVVANNWMGTTNMPLNKVIMHYTTLANADNATKTEILNSIRPHIQGDWDNFYRFNQEDLYRANMPGWAFHWGSNQQIANFGNLALMVRRYNIDVPNNAAFLQKAAEQIHYFHGVNPNNLVYLTNMYSLGGEQCANEMYHTWFNDGTIYDHALNSPNGPAPGYLTGGPNKDFTINSLSPPYNQPFQKSYLDFNTGFPMNSWEITEPAIYYQSAYIQLLSQFATAAPTVLPIEYEDFTAEQTGADVVIEAKINNEDELVELNLERSNFGNFNWTIIHQNNAASLKNGRLIHTDVKPWSGHETLYYRLKFKDKNNIINYTDIRSVQNMLDLDLLDKNKFTIYPNPVVNEINLSEISEKINIDHIQIYDINGRLVMHLNRRFESVDVSSLPTGQYRLEVLFKGSNEIKSSIFIKSP